MRLTVGYVPLTDAAPVIAAAELGFAREAGIAIELSPEPSWATLRDRLALDHLDAAHMLAPLAIASALGLSGPQAALVVPLGLSLNGNAITLSNALWQAMAPEADTLDASARAFARIARERAAAGRTLTIGTVHPFSCHTYQIRLFCERGGLDARRAVRLVVVPPPRTVDALRRGIIDGFCVGAPWNSIAVAAGLGRIAALGSEIVPDCPEKVLALHADRAEELAPLVRAVRRAGLWCADPANHAALADLLARRGELGPDAQIIRRTLSGDLVVDAAGLRRSDPAYLRLGAPAEAPLRRHARWIAEQMILSEQSDDCPTLAAAAAALYRPDLADAR